MVFRIRDLNVKYFYLLLIFALLGVYKLAYVLNPSFVGLEESIRVPSQFKKCTGCSFGGDCEFDFVTSVDFIPKDTFGTNGLSYMQFKSYVESLPRRKISPPFANDLTVGKFIRKWLNDIAESSFFTKNPSYPIYSDDITDYKWIPLKLFDKADEVSELLTKLGFVDRNVDLKTRAKVMWFKQPLQLHHNSSFPFKSRTVGASSLIYIWFYSMRYILEEQLGPLQAELLRRVQRNKIEINIISSAVTVAIHIRRGDSCERFTNHLHDINFDLGRPCYELGLYQKKLLLIQKKYTRVNIKVMSDSDQVISEMRAFATKHGFGISWLNFERQVFSVETATKNNFIEIKKLSEVNSMFVYLTLMAEIMFVSDASIFIGTSLSWVSRLAFFTIGGYREKIPEFVFLDAPFISHEVDSLIWWESHRLEDTCSRCYCSLESI